jgi:hypothetical protein
MIDFSQIVLIVICAMVSNRDLGDFPADLPEKTHLLMSSLKNIDVSIESKTSMNDSSGSLTKSYDYVETSDGRRFADMFTKNNDGRETRLKGYCDGEKCAKVVYDMRKDVANPQSRIEIGKSFMNENTFGGVERPAPLNYFYLDKIPLSDMIQPKYYRANGRSIDRPTAVFYFPNVNCSKSKLDLVYEIDVATGLPLKIASFQDQTRADQNKPAWIWTVESLTTVQGIVFPNKMRLVVFDKDDPSKTYFTVETVTKSLEFNKPHLLEEFRPKLEPGFFVIDTVKNESYLVPKRKPEKLILDERSNDDSKYLRVREEISLSTILRITIIVASIFILSLGLYLKYRSRSTRSIN